MPAPLPAAGYLAAPPGAVSGAACGADVDFGFFVFLVFFVFGWACFPS